MELIRFQVNSRARICIPVVMVLWERAPNVCLFVVPDPQQVHQLPHIDVLGILRVM